MTAAALAALAAVIVGWSYAFYRLGKWRGRRQALARMGDIGGPTGRQLAYLGLLASELGVEEPAVSTMAEASREIDRLKTIKRGRA